MVGAVDRVTCYLHHACVVPFVLMTLPVCAGSEIARTQSVLVADSSADCVSRHRLSPAQPEQGGQLMVRRAFRSDATVEAALTPSSLNICEVSFLPETEYAFSAPGDGRPLEISLTDRVHANAAVGLVESRYPALSPDGRWMAYSHLSVACGICGSAIRQPPQRGALPMCPAIRMGERLKEPAVIAPNCGRSLWLTAVARRRVMP